VNLDQTLNFTQSSFAYKDPYQTTVNPILGIKNRIWTFFAMRNIENEFVDFKLYNLDWQFKEILSEVNLAYRRSDKVGL